MTDIWMQSRFGRATDMVHPTVEQVDFWEICLTLAHINRFTGCASPSVSVAFHTLLVADLVDEPLKPYALLHDMHEARTGDISTPAAQALGEIACELYEDSSEARYVKDVIEELKGRHDGVILSAAGLPPPTLEQKAEIKIADLRALLTERRDFMSRPPKPWHESIEALEPAPNTYRDGHFGQTPSIVALNLFRTCERYFPALPAPAYAKAA